MQLAGEEKLQIPTPQYPSHLSSIYVRNATRRLKRFLPKRHSPRPPDPDSLPFPFHERQPRYGSGATGTPPEICAAPPACGRTASRISPMAAAAHMKRAAPCCSARVSLFTDGVWRRRAAAAWMADGMLGRSGGAAVVHGRDGALLSQRRDDDQRLKPPRTPARRRFRPHRPPATASLFRPSEPAPHPPLQFLQLNLVFLFWNLQFLIYSYESVQYLAEGWEKL